MNAWDLGSLVLLVGCLGPALAVGSSGDPVRRLIGLELASSATVLMLLLLCQGENQSQFLTLPLVLALLSVAGTLVYTRLLIPRPEDVGDRPPVAGR